MCYGAWEGAQRKGVRSSSEVSDACHEVGKKSKKKTTTYEDKEMVDDTVD